MNARAIRRGVPGSERIVDALIYAVLIVTSIVTLYPFLNVLAISLNDSTDSVRGGITIFPRQFTLENYKAIFTYDTLATGFKISLLRTLVGSLLGLISASMIAYTLARRDFQGRKFVSTYLAITMYVTAGLIPFYILIKDLNMMNTFAVYVLPGIVSAFNVFVVRSFMDGIPYEVQESAKIDGANDFTIYWRIILPMTKPALATIGLFLAVGQWNAWFDTYLYNGSSEHLTTLQYELVKVLQSTTNNSGDYRTQNMTQVMSTVSPDSVKMAITIFVSVPILLVYPFLQRYFVKGLTLGSVKG
ncbi:sugar ABC transporter permease [Cohnella sp. CIP 111063]|jgi:putative aldouronate transport system permease protein|uniref:carbohydrate ABC transporter permease n=1 Tax=unclassified Cohnella TaxID=2636738 RepID=UPI000B8C1DCF|nr:MULTISPECIES: carbohydrate ABC transporter permease [unclassified Cohnella]OXS55340.1 sugar ABC transporter permease [Cohnella sp. CIP 111063]PRX65777.1 carbohydrate ABC transporter membrane protein 2 (CUT1 family) [Cohnella sp. SGD-V74]